MTYDLERHDLAEIVNEGLDLLRLDQTVVQCHLDHVQNESVIVKVQKGKILQVLFNLARNAAQAIAGSVLNDSTPGRITVHTGKEDNLAYIIVKDNGPGIPEEVQSHMWEPFFSTGSEKNSGLGLDISRRIILGHSGSIQCKSSPEEGTEFLIYLPLINS